LSQDPWALFEESLVLPRVEQRRVLEAVNRLLSDLSVDASCGEKIELMACVACRLAFCGAEPLRVAEYLVEISSEWGEVGWPWFYLVEAAFEVEAWDVVMAGASRLPSRYFVDRDQRWRQARVDEFVSAALVRSGRWEEAEAAVDRLAAAFAAFGESDDFAPPGILVRALVDSHPLGHACLSALARSIDLESWLDEDLRDRVRSLA
jgi:hypothetical protein